MQEINIKVVLHNKNKWGRPLINFFSSNDKIMQIIRFTIPEERTSPTTPKLKDKILSLPLIGAPISIQSHRKLRQMPNKDNLKGRLVSSIE